MFKKLFWNLSIFIFILAFASACSGSQSGLTSTQTGTALESALDTSYTDALSVPNQLALGILKLEETDYPIDAAEAENLVPLWKVLRTLSNSDSVATEEVNAAIHQIEATLTTEQVKAIAQMRLTAEDQTALFTERGAALSQTAGNGEGLNLTAEQQATMQALRQSAEFSGGPGGGAGGPPGGGGGMGGPPDGGMGGEMGGMQAQTTQSASTTNGATATNGLDLSLVNTVINYLSQK